MRVQPYGIGPFDPSQQLLARFGHDRESAVRRVRVQPYALRLAIVRHRLKRIDGPGAHGSCICAHDDWIESCGSIVGHSAPQGFHVQAEMSVAPDGADALRGNTDNHGSTSKCNVALVAHVHRSALGVTRRFPRCHESVNTAHRAPTRQDAGRTFRIAEPAPEPIYDDQLNLARAACGKPGGHIDVVTCGHKVGDYSRPCRRRRDESKEPRMFKPSGVGENLARRPLNDSLRRPTQLRRILHQRRLEAVAKLPVPGVSRRRSLCVVHQQLGHHLREIQHLIGCHQKVVVNIIRRTGMCALVGE